MRALLLLAALASPAVTPAPLPQPISAPQASPAQDAGQTDPKLLPLNKRIYDRRIQVRPGSTKPTSEGKSGPGIG